MKKEIIALFLLVNNRSLIINKPQVFFFSMFHGFTSRDICLLLIYNPISKTNRIIKDLSHPLYDNKIKHYIIPVFLKSSGAHVESVGSQVDADHRRFFPHQPVQHGPGSDRRFGASQTEGRG